LWATGNVVRKSTGWLPKRLTQPVWRHRSGFPRCGNRPADAARGRSPGVRRVFVHAHCGAHKMGPQWARRDLQGEAPPLDGIVVAHPAVLLDAQDLAHPAGAIVERRCRPGRRHREGDIVGRAIALSEPSIGRRYCGDAGQSQLLRQPILQRRKARSERPRLGRIARDVADAELRQRARPAFAGSSTPPPRPWACGNSGRDRCRAHKTARAGRSPRPARESSMPCPPPRR